VPTRLTARLHALQAALAAAGITRAKIAQFQVTREQGREVVLRLGWTPTADEWAQFGLGEPLDELVDNRPPTADSNARSQ